MNKAMIFTHRKTNEEDLIKLSQWNYSLNDDDCYSFLINGQLSGVFYMVKTNDNIDIKYLIDSKYNNSNYVDILINKALLEIENQYPNIKLNISVHKI